jgi:hypothetical protein
MKCRSHDLFVALSIEMLNTQFHEDFCNKISMCVGLYHYAVISRNVENWLLGDEISHPSRQTETFSAVLYSTGVIFDLSNLQTL